MRNQRTGVSFATGTVALGAIGYLAYAHRHVIDVNADAAARTFVTKIRADTPDRSIVVASWIFATPVAYGIYGERIHRAEHDEPDAGACVATRVRRPRRAIRKRAYPIAANDTTRTTPTTASGGRNLAGASGYLLKAAPADDIGALIRLTLRGYASFAPGIIHDRSVPAWFDDVPQHALEALTRRERDVLRELASGASNRKIADRLGLTEGTARNYVTRILSQLSVRSRTEAALFALAFRSKPSRPTLGTSVTTGKLRREGKYTPCSRARANSTSSGEPPPSAYAWSSR